MQLSDLLLKHAIDPEGVIVLRHRPYEPEFKKVFPWLAADRPDLFNAYQQTQGARLEKSMMGATHVASFIGHAPGKALFIGLYSIGHSKSLTREEYWKIPEYIEMQKLGMVGFTEKEQRKSILWFDLTQVHDFFASWKGKLIVGWPPPERAWWRRAHRNEMPVLAILEDSALDTQMPEWYEIKLTWEQLRFLPKHWKSALSQWRAIYYIFDTLDGKGYVGSAYGADNLHHRWENYGVSGHGGNILLRKRDPRNFLFTILQRVSPDMDADDVCRIEATWKERLHTRAPHGLNDN